MYMHYETQFLLVLCNSTINYNILKYVYDSLSFVNGIKFYESMDPFVMWFAKNKLL